MFGKADDAPAFASPNRDRLTHRVLTGKRPAIRHIPAATAPYPCPLSMIVSEAEFAICRRKEGKMMLVRSGALPSAPNGDMTMAHILPLKGRLAADIDAVNPADAQRLRWALFDLGYYDNPSRLYDDRPDPEVFRALRLFQRDNDLIPDGSLEPGGPTARMLAAALDARPGPRRVHPGAAPGTLADRPVALARRVAELDRAIEMGATAARLLAAASRGDIDARRRLAPYRTLAGHYRSTDHRLAALFEAELRHVPAGWRAEMGFAASGNSQ